VEHDDNQTLVHTFHDNRRDLTHAVLMLGVANVMEL
jgi:hypothetical protein